MKKLFLFLFPQLFYVLSFADRLSNAKFHDDPELKRTVTIQNLEVLNQFNKHNFVAASCPSSRKRPELKIPEVMSQLKYTNVQCSKVESTNVFYKGGEPYTCDLDVTLLKYNYSQNYLKNISRRNQEEILSTYWNDDRIIARWNYIAQSLIKCKIRVKNIRMISFEKMDSDGQAEPPIMDDRSPEFNQLISSFAEIEREKSLLSPKFMYLQSLNDENKKIKYYAAESVFFEPPNHPSSATAIITTQSLAVPMFSNGYRKGLGCFSELHELGHILPRLGNSAHIDSIKEPETFNPMVNSYERCSSDFTEEQCQELRAAGFGTDPKNRLLQCHEERTINL